MRSVGNKRESLSSLIDTCSADIVILTETWLSNQIANHEVFECERSYKFFHRDCEQQTGCGLLIAIHDTISCGEITISTHLEFVRARITVDSKDFISSAYYRSPSSTNTFCNEVSNILSNLAQHFSSCPLFLVGDINFPGIDWKTQPTVIKGGSECLEFIILCLDFNLAQLVTKPTRSSSHLATVLYLILTTTLNLVPSAHFPGVSDHCLLLFGLPACTPSVKPSKIICDYKNADVAAIYYELSSFISEYLPSLYTHCTGKLGFV